MPGDALGAPCSIQKGSVMGVDSLGFHRMPDTRNIIILFGIKFGGLKVINLTNTFHGVELIFLVKRSKVDFWCS